MPPHLKSALRARARRVVGPAAQRVGRLDALRLRRRRLDGGQRAGRGAALVGAVRAAGLGRAGARLGVAVEAQALSLVEVHEDEVAADERAPRHQEEGGPGPHPCVGWDGLGVRRGGGRGAANWCSFRSGF